MVAWFFEAGLAYGGKNAVGSNFTTRRMIKRYKVFSITTGTSRKIIKYYCLYSQPAGDRGQSPIQLWRSTSSPQQPKPSSPYLKARQAALWNKFKRATVTVPLQMTILYYKQLWNIAGRRLVTWTPTLLFPFRCETPTA